MSPNTIDLLLLSLFFVGSFFFSGFESGVVSVDRHKLLYKMRHGDKKAMAIAALLRNTHRMLATVLVGNNICNIAISVLIAGLGFRLAAERGQVWLGFAGVIITLITGEYLPKRWSCARPIERVGPLMGTFHFFQMFLSPLATVCIFLTRIFDRRNKNKPSPFVSRESIEVITRYSEERGKISSFERLIIKQVLSLQMKKASQIMTPINRVIYVTNEMTPVQCIDLSQKHDYSLLPVFSTDKLKCFGVLNVFELIQGKMLYPHYQSPAYVSPETPADELLPYMRREKRRLLFVRNEQTGTILGIIKQNDILLDILDDRLLRASTDRKSIPLPIDEDE